MPDDQTDKHDTSTLLEPTLGTTWGAADSSGCSTAEGGRVPSDISNCQCEICQMFFINPKVKIEHIKMYHREAVVGCRFRRQHKFEPAFDKHLMLKHDICSAGKEPFADQDSLRGHHQVCRFMRRPTPQPQSGTNTDVTMDTAPQASSTHRPDVEPTPLVPAQQRLTGSPRRASRTYVCGPCGKTFDTEHGLSMHKSNKHKVKVRQTKCDKCDKVFQSLGQMLQHCNAKQT